MVRYVGWYSNRMRGDRSKADEAAGESEQKKVEENEIIVVGGFKRKKVSPLIWRECTPRAFVSRHIKKIWEVDPLLCPHCGGLMRIISFIYEIIHVNAVAWWSRRGSVEDRKGREPDISIVGEQKNLARST
jgi:hypothetical protein